MTTKITSKSGRELKATARRTGKNFGWIGEVKAKNGRVIASTDDVFPHEGAAIEAAEKLAETL